MSVCWSNASTPKTTEPQNVLRILLSRRPVRVHRERASSVDVSCSGMMKTQSNGGIHNSDGLLYFIPQEDHSSNMCLVAPLVHEYAGPETHEECCHALPVGNVTQRTQSLTLGNGGRFFKKLYSSFCHTFNGRAVAYAGDHGHHAWALVDQVMPRRASAGFEIISCTRVSECETCGLNICAVTSR